MERLLKFYLNIFIVLLFFSCDEEVPLKNSNNRKEATKVYNEAIKYYQGTAPFQNGIIDAINIDPTYDEAIRELSIAYLKRGIPHEWKKRIDVAVEINPKGWQGYRGYNYLWFYRNYKKAIADFDATDSLTPKFIDAPQGHSVDYWRGIAYLGLKDYKNSIAYWDKHIAREIEESGEDWVEINAFLYRGIAYYESGDLDKALENFDTLLRIFKNISADAKYYKALILKDKGQVEKAKLILDSAIEDFNNGYFNSRPYVETLRQLYAEDLENLQKSLYN